MRSPALLLGLLLAACGPASALAPKVVVDPRFELLAIVHSLAGLDEPLPGFAFNDSDYSRRARERFLPFKGHRAVAAYGAAARRGGLDIIAAQKLMLDLSDPPALAARREPSFNDPALLEALRAFARDSNFMDFFKKNRADRALFEAAVASQAASADYPAMLEAYTGLRPRTEYTLILAVLRPGHEGNMNHIECGEKEAYRIFSTIGPEQVVEGRPDFAYAHRRWDAWHELSHTLFDRSLARHADKVSASSALFEPISGSCYGSWAQCLREHVAQGLAYRVLAWADETGRTRDFVWKPQPKKSLPYLAAVGERLKEFEARRDLYPTLAEFYPRLIDVFVELAGSPEFRGRPKRPAEVTPANSECRQAESRSEASVPPPAPAEDPKTARQLKERGVWRFSQGQAGPAAADFEAALALEPGDAECRLDLAVALLQLGRLEAAREAAGAAVLAAGRDPAEPLLAAEALSTRATAWERLARPGEARADLERALELAPETWKRRAETRARLEGLK